MGLKEGISSITKRHAKANNHYIPDYNPDKPESYLIYLYANNFYGWAMSQLIPVNNFKFLSSEELEEKFPLCNLKDILQLLLVTYSMLTWSILKTYGHTDTRTTQSPPEKLTINSSMYSPFMQQHYGNNSTTTKIYQTYVTKQIT